MVPCRARVCGRASPRLAACQAWTAGRWRRASTTKKILVLRRNRQKAEDGDARPARLPTPQPARSWATAAERRCASAADWHSRPAWCPETVDEHTHAGSGIAVDHQDSRKRLALTTEIEKWWPIITAAGIQVE